MSVFWADYDGDGDLDVLVANTAEADMLFRNELRGSTPQAGHFTPFTLNELNLPPGAVNGGGWMDIDRDGDLDLVTTSIYGAALLINTGEGDVPFEFRPSVLDQFDNVRDLAPGDFDLDGDVDLAVLRRDYLGNAFLVNIGGLLTHVAGPLSNAFDDGATGCWGYLDDDLYPELFVANVTGSANRLYINDDGVLVLDATSAAADDLGTQSCAWGDYDGDGDFDLFIGKEHSYSGIPNPGPLANRLFRNDDGVLVPVTVDPVTTDLHRSIGAAWGDVDNDGDLDLVVSNHDAPEFVYINDGAGGFESFPLGESSDGRSMGVSLVDDDEDGDLDLYVANGGPRLDLPPEHNRFFRNTTHLDTSRHWVQFDLRGVDSDRFGVGARVKVFDTVQGAPRSQVRAVMGRPYRLSHDGYRVHVGLGSSAWVDSLIVEWPASQADTIRGLAADTIHVIHEHPQVVGTSGEPAQRWARLRVYPNPVRGAFTLVASGVTDGPVRALLVDVLGRVIATFDGRATHGIARLTFDHAGTLRPGRYMIRLFGTDAPPASLTVL